MEARYLQVKNWERFQHYHNRPHAPYWIKLYVELLDDYEFNRLSERDRGRLLRIWLLASRLRNLVPFDDKYVARAISATGAFALQPFIDAGWLEFADEVEASTPTSRPTSRPASRSGSSPETEAEKKREELAGQSPTKDGSALPDLHSIGERLVAKLTPAALGTVERLYELMDVEEANSRDVIAEEASLLTPARIERVRDKALSTPSERIRKSRTALVVDLLKRENRRAA